MPMIADHLVSVAVAAEGIASLDAGGEIDVRSAAMMIWELAMMAQSAIEHLSILDKFRSYYMYAVEYPGRRKGKPVMDVKAMVERWVPIIRGFATAHDKAEVDQCEFVIDEHLIPLLSAPVKQVREFYAALVLALKADPTIPFFVWAMFDGWGEVILKSAPDGDVKTLKTALAAQIAEMVEQQVQPDLRAAIAGALQWRSPEALEKVRTEIEKGTPARMVGRNSCLFLQVGDATVML